MPRSSRPSQTARRQPATGASAAFAAELRGLGRSARRHHLLYNPIVKMKVTTQGEEVINLLWDVIAAKGFEKDTYFEMAARDIRALPKLVNPQTGRVHTSYNQAGTVTGRLSSSNPNLQNIPIRTELGRQIRKAFVAQPGFVFLAADYSQVELRILAHISGDEALLENFRQGLDIHAATASQVSRSAVAEPRGFHLTT